jgi:DNA-binding CsgD family transcriptional regulator
MTTLQVTASRSAADLPFGAVAPLLHAALPEPGTVDDRSDLLRRSVAALAEPADGPRRLVFVDDAHLLDDASATLIHQVAVMGAATILATVGAGEHAPDPVVALWKDGLARRVDVDGLGRESIEELLSSVLGGAVDPATAVEFTERCQGNVLFLRELVVGALDDGSLRSDGGLWRLVQRLSPSARLVEIVETRLGRLGEEERALMEIVSFGEPLGQAELATLFDPALAEALERRNLLASHLEGRRLQLHLAHPIYGDVLRAGTPALRTRKIAELLADAFEAIGYERHEDLLRVATWRYMAGGGDPDVLLEGATIARWRYDFPLAENLARAAVDAGAGFDAALLAAHLAGLQGRRDEAEGELVRLAAEAVDDVQRGQVAVTRFDNTFVVTGRDSFGVLDEAEHSISDADWRHRLESRRLVELLGTEGPGACVEPAQRLVTEAGGDAQAFACLIGALCLGRLGRLDAALELSDRGFVARQMVVAPPSWYVWWHTVAQCLALLTAGRFEEAEKIIEAHHSQALAEGSTEAQGVFAVLGGVAVGDRGRVVTAASRAREALAVNQQLGRLVLVRQDHIVRALALALGGRPDEAADELEALDALGLPPLLHDEVDLIQARAWTTAAAGDIPGACDQLLQAADLGVEIGDLRGEVAALHGLARMGRAREVQDRLAAASTRVEGDLAPARAVHTAALARRDAAALEAVSLDFEAMGADLLAAEASADAAVARHQAGEQRDASAAERRASLLAARCEDPETPALQAIELRVRLTTSERDAAVLAEAGRSNKEIAAQLHLSPRTVENRLQRVYEKLGIAGRSELTEALARGE